MTKIIRKPAGEIAAGRSFLPHSSLSDERKPTAEHKVRVKYPSDDLRF